MIASITTAALAGVEARRVDVEVSLAQGLPNVFIIGLPDGAVREARLRVENALKSLGIRMPTKRVTISLAPGDLRKAGCSYDLPIAVGLLCAMGLVPTQRATRLAFAGELGLDGSLRGVRGTLALASLAHSMQLDGVVVPAANADEASLAPEVVVHGPRSLEEVIAHLNGEQPIAPHQRRPVGDPLALAPDLQDVCGQVLPKRALEIAAAGGHHLLFVGPPGAGKTMLAERLSSLLPPLCADETLEVTRIYSAAGLLGTRTRAGVRPFRAPHHTASRAALVGGGASLLRIGEVTLAHRGVLFLDEAPELPRSTLDALRQPLESGEMQVLRSGYQVVLPCRFQLVLAMNPCPCGHDWEQSPRECRCPPGAAERYRSRISGPLLDRIDLLADVNPVGIGELSSLPSGDSSATVRSRVRAARAHQAARLGEQAVPLNAWIPPAKLRDHCQLDPKTSRFLTLAAEKLALTGRGFHRVLRVARTVADLAGDERVALPAVREALAFRTHFQGDRTWESRTPSNS